MHLQTLVKLMEPPSPIGTNRENVAGPHSDDPLSRSFSPDAYLILTRTSGDEDQEGGYVVCVSSAATGTVWIGTTGTTGS